MMRIKAIWNCLKYGLLPWWTYEKEKHYNCGYWQHLWINLTYACRWLLCKETDSDIQFEKEINNNF